MGCMESRLVSADSTLPTESNKKNLALDRKTLNITFSDFVKANTGKVYEDYQFTGWVSRSQNSIVRWAWHRRSTA